MLKGKATAVKKGKSTVVKVTRRQEGTGGGTDEYVELGREGTDKIFVDPRRVRQPASPELPRHGLRPGHARPDDVGRPAAQRDPGAGPHASTTRRTGTRTTPSDYFQNLYFGDGGTVGSGGTQETVKQWYERQSSGRYSIDGQVSDWVKVAYNEARYGRSNGYRAAATCAPTRGPSCATP